MSHSVRRHLALDIEEYDQAIRRFIPGYETMLTVIADVVAEGRPATVVDLGAGTGALSAAILSRSEVGMVALVDVDPEMLAQARARLERFGDRARYALGSFDEPIATCDAVVASLALHHLSTLSEKTTLFERIFAALEPGGVFVNGDVNMPDDDALRAPLYRRWADHLVASGIDEARAWRHFEEWAGEDTYLPLEAELDAWRYTGFEAEVVWTSDPIGVVVGRKPTR